MFGDFVDRARNQQTCRASLQPEKPGDEDISGPEKFATVL
jgi:hypothetical protein